MGGNAVPSARRMVKETFEQYCSEVQLLFPELKMKPVLSFRGKETFGDIDIIVQKEPDLNVKALVRKRLDNPEFYDNGPYFSFLYKDAQVDFIFAPAEEFEMTFQYMNWNDIGNFFGRVARSMNFKYGHDGLSYEKHLDDHYKISIVVSRDVSKILPFLGYDYDRWLKGFDTENDIFEYTVSSPHFNSLYFDLYEQNHNDRVRNKKRKMYQKILQYIHDNNIQGRAKLTEAERMVEYQRAVDTFGSDFDKEVRRKIAEYDKRLRFKALYNGDVVSAATGLQGKKLGEFMQWVKANFPTYEEFILNAKQVEIEKWVQSVFERWKLELSF